MDSYTVPISFGRHAHWICLRELCGADEMAVMETGTIGAIDLLNRLLLDVPETAILSGQAAEMTTSDRDRALGAVFSLTYGDRIESTIRCQVCELPFDLNFSLRELMNHIFAEREPIQGLEATENGYFCLENGRQFRLPTGKDECAVLGLSMTDAEQELMIRCCFDFKTTEAPENLQQIMQQVAPVINIDLNATCPECGQAQTLHFDLQQYLLASLIQEKKQLAFEVHQLAKAYGWGLNEILELPRSIRRMYVTILASEQG